MRNTERIVQNEDYAPVIVSKRGWEHDGGRGGGWGRKTSTKCSLSKLISIDR